MSPPGDQHQQDDETGAPSGKRPAAPPPVDLPAGASVAPSTPDIGPPLLLEPIPPPTVLSLDEDDEPSEATPPPAEVDPYAWAMSVEREHKPVPPPSTPAYQVDRARPGPRVSGSHPALRSGAQPVVTPSDPGFDRVPPRRRQSSPEQYPERFDRSSSSSTEVPTPPPAQSSQSASPPPPDVDPMQRVVRIATLVAVFAIATASTALVILLFLAPTPEAEAPAADPPTVVAPRPRFAVPPAATTDPKSSLPVARPFGIQEEGAVAHLLSIESDPPGAVVRLSGRMIGYTPARVEVPPGGYEVDLQLDGYKPWHQSVSVQDDATVNGTLEREVRVGSVRLVAPEYEGYPVRVDGEPVGTIPTTVKLESGRHEITIQTERGPLSVERDVRVQPGRTVVVDLMR